MDYKMVVYTGGAYRIRKGLCPPQFSAHGMTFKTGIVYKVTDDVFEYVKGIRGFIEIKGIGKNIQSFEAKSEKNDKSVLGKRPSESANRVFTSDEKPAESFQTS